MTASGTILAPQGERVAPAAQRPQSGAGRSQALALFAARHERLHSVDELLAPCLCLLQVGLELEGLLVARLERVVDSALGGGQCASWLRSKLSRQLADLLLETVLGYDPVDDPQTVGVGRAQRLAGEEH